MTEMVKDDVQELRKDLEKTQAAYISVVMERNFLQRAMADLNFHHNAHDGIVFTDVENRVVYANPYFLEMMGIDNPAEILGKPLPDYMWDNPNEAAQLFTDIQKNGFVRERELKLVNRKKSPVFAMCSSVVSKDNDGKFIGTEIMLCNITSKRRIQVELEQHARNLERITEFTRATLDSLLESVERGATGAELRSMLKSLKAELAETTKKMNAS